MPVETPGAAFHLAPKSFRPGYLAPYYNRSEMTGYPLSWTPEFYLGFIIWGRSPEWLKATSFLRGFWRHAPPRNFLKWMCAKMQSGAFWATILRNVTVCALTSSRRDDFSDIVTYTVIITIFFSGKLGILGGRGKLLPLKYPTQNPEP